MQMEEETLHKHTRKSRRSNLNQPKMKLQRAVLRRTSKQNESENQTFRDLLNERQKTSSKRNQRPMKCQTDFYLLCTNLHTPNCADFTGYSLFIHEFSCPFWGDFYWNVCSHRGSSLSNNDRTVLSPATSSSSTERIPRRSQAGRETLCLYTDMGHPQDLWYVRQTLGKAYTKSIIEPVLVSATYTERYSCL